MRLKADIAQQIVLLPHLVSLAEGYEGVETELCKSVEHGWASVFPLPPFIPFRAHPKGSTSKKGTNDKRPTTNWSAPHRRISDGSGTEVIPVNQAPMM